MVNAMIIRLVIVFLLFPINSLFGSGLGNVKIVNIEEVGAAPITASFSEPFRYVGTEKADEICHSTHRKLECSSCISKIVHSRVINESLAMIHQWDASARFDSIVTKLIDVYQSTIIPASSTKMCFIGEYSTQILSTILSLNDLRVVRLFLPLHQLTPDELSELEHLKESREPDSLIIVDIPDFETFTHSVNSVDCDMFHFRLSSRISVEYVNELVNWLSDWPTALQSNSGMIPVIMERHSSLGMKENIKVTVGSDGGSATSNSHHNNYVETKVKWTLQSKLSQSYYPTRMQNGVTINHSAESGSVMIVNCSQLLSDNPLVQSQSTSINVDGNVRGSSDINAIELLVGCGRFRRPHLFADFHRRQLALQQSSEHCINNSNNGDSCAWLDKESRVFHYKNMNNSVTESIHKNMRKRNNYTTDIYDSSTGSDNTNGSAINGMLMIVTFSYNGELMVPLHLEYLYASVDMFVIVEARIAHSGRPKEFLYIVKHAKMFEPYLDKIQFIVIDSFPALPSDWLMRGNYPLDKVNLKESNKTLEDFGASWHREKYQRDIVADLLDRIYPQQDQKYLLLVVDADELIALPDGQVSQIMSHYDILSSPGFFVTHLFYYNFNCHVGHWYQSFMVNDMAVRRLPLSSYRTTEQPKDVFYIRGWHLSYFSSYHYMVRKLESFAHLEYNHDKYKNIDNIADKVSKCQNIFDNSNMTQFEDWEDLPEVFRTFQPIVLRYQQDRWSHSHLLHATIWITIHEAFHLLPTAYDLQKAIKRMGFEKVHVRSEVDMSEYDRIDRLGVRDFNEHGLQLQISLVDHSYAYIAANGADGTVDNGFVLPTLLLLQYGDSNNHTTPGNSCASLWLTSLLHVTSNLHSNMCTTGVETATTIELNTDRDSEVCSMESSEQSELTKSGVVDVDKLRTALLTCLDNANQSI